MISLAIFFLAIYALIALSDILTVPFSPPAPVETSFVGVSSKQPGRCGVSVGFKAWKWMSSFRNWLTTSERNRAYCKVYHKQKKAKIAKRKKQFRRDNIEVVLISERRSKKRFLAAHPGYGWPKYKQLHAAIRARRKNAPVGNLETIKLWESKWNQKKSVRCYWCQNHFQPSQCHTDHITALALGGPHTIENLCVSCSQCNKRKQAQTVTAWNQRITAPVLAL